MDTLTIVFIPIAIIGLIVTYSKGRLAAFLSRPIAIYTAVILWTLLGFIFVLDNSMAMGCIGGAGEILSIENISYSGFSLLFISVGFFWTDKKALIVLLGELVYWTIKLMKVKGGYVVGLVESLTKTL